MTNYSKFAPALVTPSAPSQRGETAFAVAQNNAYSRVATPAPAAANSGNVVPQFNFTPKSTGKLLIIANVSGTLSAGSEVFINILVNGVANKMTEQAGAAETVLLSRAFVVSGLPVNTAALIQFRWQVVTGGVLFQVRDDEGEITVLEIL